MKRQRGSILITLLIYGAIALAVSAAIYGVWRSVNGWCNGACVEAREERDAATAEGERLAGLIKAAQERATALALMWSEAVQRVEVRYVERAATRSTEFAGIRERAGRIAHAEIAIPVPLSADVVRLLNDVHAAANDAGAGPAAGAGDEGAALPGAARIVPVGEWVRIYEAGGEAFRDTDDARLECIERYNAVRESIIRANAEPAAAASSQ
jgi:hypothetical protein